MRSASGPLTTLLNSNTQFRMADLFTFTLVDGTILRYTTADIDIVLSGNTFYSSKLKITRGSLKFIVGVEVDMMALTISATSAELINNIPFLQAVASGMFDGAKVRLERAFMATWGDTSAGSVILFTGYVGEVSLDRLVCTMDVNSLLFLLNTQMPKYSVQAGCVHNLFDAGCTLNPASFDEAETAGSGCTTQLITSASAQADDYFTLGKIVFTSGQNNGLSRTVKAFGSGSFSIIQPLPYIPAPGDTFTAYPGCDKTMNTCKNKFNNLVNIKAFPFVSVPETAIGITNN
jgi:uncharacterized phage protein (TIGR02218 family)